MNVLVTGATGAVGPCVVQAFCEAGHAVRTLSLDRPHSRRQRTDDRRRTTEDGLEKRDGRRRMADDGRQMTDRRRRKTDDGRQKTDGRGQTDGPMMLKPVLAM